MRKIKTLYRRNPDDRKHVIVGDVVSGCEPVARGEAFPTRKFDGTCVMLDRDGKWWARREVKPGKQPPAGFLTAQHDEETGKTVGWEPIDQSPFAKFHTEALAAAEEGTSFPWEPGTFELCGPKINGNPERFDHHALVPHGAYRVDSPAKVDGQSPEHLIAICRERGFEGVVWWLDGAPLAKLKVRDIPETG